MTDVNFTFRTPHELKEAFMKRAKANNRTAAILLRDFMQSYVAQDDDAGTTADTSSKGAGHGSK